MNTFKNDSFCFPDLVLFDLHGTLLKSVGDVGYFHVSDELYEGTEELLEYLNNNGAKLAIVSNSYSIYAFDEIENAHAEQHFDLICGIDTFHTDNDIYSALFKPSIILGDKIIDFFELSKQNSCVWMIGDHDYDIEFGVNNDFISIGYNNDYAEEYGYLNYYHYSELLNDIKEYQY